MLRSCDWSGSSIVAIGRASVEETTFEESALCRVACSIEGCQPGDASCLVPPEIGQQIGPRRVEEVVTIEVSCQLVDIMQRNFRPVYLTQRDRSIEPDDWRRRELDQPVVQEQDLGPIRGLPRCR